MSSATCNQEADFMQIVYERALIDDSDIREILNYSKKTKFRLLGIVLAEVSNRLDCHHTTASEMTLEAKSFSCFNQYNLGTGDLRFDSLQLFDYAEARDDQAVVQ